MHWTKEVEEMIMTRGYEGITEYHASLQDQLNLTVELVR